MLPEPENSPSFSLKCGIYFMVSLYVSRNLHTPPVGILGRSLKVIRTSMPEAAIKEDCHTFARKDNIGFSRKFETNAVSVTAVP